MPHHQHCCETPKSGNQYRFSYIQVAAEKKRVNGVTGLPHYGYTYFHWYTKHIHRNTGNDKIIINNTIPYSKIIYDHYVDAHDDKINRKN
jgi:hypothetical protein